MYELRPLINTDIDEIKDCLVESRNNIELAAKLAMITVPKPAYTYLKDGKVVACCGAVQIDSQWHIWALISAKFSCYTRARAIIAFKKKLPEIGGRARIDIPSDLPNGYKYAKFLGGVFKGEEPDRIWAGITNSIYEVAIC
ncbi:MAG: hypothetical protein KKB59_18555 [Spirochaetes bacterium]|nr:hypothetical protein [Spirochaetota bacterium]